MDRRESLTARYERVLGRPLADVDSEDHNDGGSESTPASRSRRQQVLHAQRTHRNRTQQYIRELENEVYRLRDENDQLRQTMDQMKTEEIGRADLADPSMVRGTASGSQRQQQQQQQQIPVAPGVDANTMPAQAASTVVADLTDIAKVVPESACEGQAAEDEPPTYHTDTTPRSHPESGTHYTAVSGTGESVLTAQAGVNFILTLEYPCLAHVKHAHMGYSTGTTPRDISYNSGPGHLLNLSAALTHRYHGQQDLEASPITIPSTDVERLLEASGRLKLDGEITPVQIWERLREVERQGMEVHKEDVDALTKQLGSFVYCNSFGAVVETATAEAVLAEWLGEIVK